MVVALVAVVMSACASTPKLQAQPRKDLVAFLADGHSTCTQVVENLGNPSEQYEDGRLLTYRIAGDSASGYLVVSTRGWDRAHYSLVVQCDGQGNVQAHAMVNVKRAP